MELMSNASDTPMPTDPSTDPTADPVNEDDFTVALDTDPHVGSDFRTRSLGNAYGRDGLQADLLTIPNRRHDLQVDVAAAITEDPVAFLEACKRSLAEALKWQKHVSRPYPPQETEPGMAQIDPFCTYRQRGMTWHYERFGVAGLADYFIRIAQEEVEKEQTLVSTSRDTPGSPTDAPPKKVHHSWRILLDNVCEAKQTMVYYLSSLPPELIEALIAGNLPSRMTEEIFHKKISPYVQLQDCQGTYCLYLAVARQRTSSTQEALSAIDVGKSLTLIEMQRIYDDMRLYIDIGDPASEQIAMKIDRQRSGASTLRDTLEYSKQRRYGSGGNHDKFHHHKIWLDFIDMHYLRWARAQSDQDLLKKRLERCFVYAGLASNVSGRAPNHWKHIDKISPMVGLLAATLQHRYPDVFSVESHTYQIFKTVAHSHIGIDEKLTTLLSSAYSWDGGLSIALAGVNCGSGVSDFTQDKYDQLAKSKREIDSSPIRSKNLETAADRTEKTLRNFEAIKNAEKDHREAMEQTQNWVAICQANVERATNIVKALNTSNCASPVSDLKERDRACAELCKSIERHENARTHGSSSS